MLGSHRRISGSHRSRVGQILRSRLVYIRGAGQSPAVLNLKSAWHGGSMSPLLNLDRPSA